MVYINAQKTQHTLKKIGKKEFKRWMMTGRSDVGCPFEYCKYVFFYWFMNKTALAYGSEEYR